MGNEKGKDKEEKKKQKATKELGKSAKKAESQRPSRVGSSRSEPSVTGSGHKGSQRIPRSFHPSSGVTLLSGQIAPWLLDSNHSQARTPSVKLSDFKSSLKSLMKLNSGASRSKLVSGGPTRPLLQSKQNIHVSGSKKASQSQKGGSQRSQTQGGLSGTNTGSLKRSSQTGSQSQPQIRTSQRSQSQMRTPQAGSPWRIVGSQVGSQSRARTSQKTMAQRASQIILQSLKESQISSEPQLPNSQRASGLRQGTKSHSGSISPSNQGSKVKSFSQIQGSSLGPTLKQDPSAFKKASGNLGDRSAIEGRNEFYRLTTDQLKIIIKLFMEHVNWQWFHDNMYNFTVIPRGINSRNPLDRLYWMHAVSSFWYQFEEFYNLYWTVQGGGLEFVHQCFVNRNPLDHLFLQEMVIMMMHACTGWRQGYTCAIPRQLEILNAMVTGKPWLKYVKEWCDQNGLKYRPFPGQKI
ncbi:uncharacterized protein PAC_17342 [Phialocephala subalpina]|uniref:Uncharacterized protein n=1 Tax=Phialocephala subalpina TaxID=576137 RepID=A0A1L7XQX1_9HELO|nr:uncharacterized protein PAC_17342 [Phialocephala subalpina]